MIKQIAFFVGLALVLSAGAMVFDKRSGSYASKADRQASPASANTRHDRIVAISANGSGQFSVSTLVNGLHVEMLADTGATLVVLTEDDARRAGVEMASLTYDTPVKTANGTSMTARVLLGEVAVGGIVQRKVEALVAPNEALGISLLGMSFIGKLARFELRGDQLVLTD
ncbi:MAG: TIGR02281 family clan AA aspartic protease [Rhodobiaceae bacterium]|nr:TIGR02281 family clan AA aspartic protease [Rhodobiaceae bacterium]